LVPSSSSISLNNNRVTTLRFKRNFGREARVRTLLIELRGCMRTVKNRSN